jgi:frataxin-like iron-binding protein CyaY
MMNILLWIILVFVSLLSILFVVVVISVIVHKNKKESLEDYLKRKNVEMNEAKCDYTLNLSKSNMKLWKACHNGYDRYFIQEKDWFKNNINQSKKEKDLCIGRALQEVLKRTDYSYDTNNKKEMELWITKEC